MKVCCVPNLACTHKLYQTSGISRDKTMADKLINIHNDDTQNLPVYRLQLDKTFEILTK